MDRRRALMAFLQGVISTGAQFTKTVYTQSTAWTTDSNGNAQNFANTYCNSGDGVYLAVVKNNTASNYAAQSMIVGRGSVNGVTLPLGHARRSNGNSSIVASTSFYVTAGATITVWYCSKSQLEATL